MKQQRKGGGGMRPKEDIIYLNFVGLGLLAAGPRHPLELFIQSTAHVVLVVVGGEVD